MGQSAKNKQAALSAKMFEATEKQLKRYNEEQVVQRKLLETQKEVYRGFEFKNPYADMQNAFGGLRTGFRNLAEDTENVYEGMENMYEGMENVYEDMTVDMRAADFQAQQGQQQRANILQGLRGAAGTSGVAGLAQTLANQGALQSQQIAAGISQQERQNQMMAAQGQMQIEQMQRGAGMQLQQMERAGAAQQQQMILAGAERQRALTMSREQLIAQGAAQADMTIRGGEAMVQSAEMQRQSTLLGIEYGGMAGANAGVQAAYANQMSGFATQASMLNSQLQFTGQMMSAGASMVPTSDRRLKKNINKIGESPSGLNIYSFEFKDSKYGEGLFQGVMSDEVPQKAIGKRDGYDTVDYNMLDVEFKQI